MHPWYIRIWQKLCFWSITIEGEMIWWSSDDNHLRKRKLDHEVQVPRMVFRPFCLVFGNHRGTKANHSNHYDFCIYCNKRLTNYYSKSKRIARWPHYRVRTWLRGHAPDFLQGILAKGNKNCGKHEWYTYTKQSNGCYHCTIVRKR